MPAPLLPQTPDQGVDFQAFYLVRLGSAQAVGATPQQIISIKSKNELPQIKFIKDYKPELEKILKYMDAEFEGLRAV